MKTLVIAAILFTGMQMNAQEVYDFSPESKSRDWFVVDDGKNYPFRVRSQLNERHSYQYEFPSTGAWQEVTVPFDQMIPTFRGMRLNLPNYPGEFLRECSFLISNKKNESFRLEIDRIWME